MRSLPSDPHVWEVPGRNQQGCHLQGDRAAYHQVLGATMQLTFQHEPCFENVSLGRVAIPRDHPVWYKYTYMR